MIFIIKWTINFRGILYAVFIFDKKFKLQRESTQVKTDKLKDKLQEDLRIYDPRNGMFENRNMDTVEDRYEADLFLTQLFPEPEYTRDRKGLDWSKVLEKTKPGIFY